MAVLRALPSETIAQYVERFNRSGSGWEPDYSFLPLPGTIMAAPPPLKEDIMAVPGPGPTISPFSPPPPTESVEIITAPFESFRAVAPEVRVFVQQPRPTALTVTEVPGVLGRLGGLRMVALVVLGFLVIGSLSRKKGR